MDGTGRRGRYRMSRRQQSLLGIFRVPLLVGILSLAGLILALLIEGSGEWLVAITVACPLAVIVWAYRRQ